MEENSSVDVRQAGSEPQPAAVETGPSKPDDERVIEPENALPEVTLEGLPESLQAACGRAGWTKLLPVQTRTIPYVLA